MKEIKPSISISNLRMFLFPLLILFFFNATSQGVWTQKADMGGSSRQLPACFSIGTKGYIGTGRPITGFYLKDFWEWDQSTNSWTQKADFGGTERAGAVGFSIGTKGYFATGVGGTSVYVDLWEYDPGSNLWTQKTSLPSTFRYCATAFTFGTKGYICLGTFGLGVYWNDLWEYDQSTDAWTQKANFAGLARSLAMGFTVNGKAYIGTGDMGSILPVRDFWEYNPSIDSWTQVADFPGGIRKAGISFSIDSMGYAGAGHGSFGADQVQKQRSDFWKYNPVTNSWTALNNIPVPRFEAISFSIGQKGYFGTGIDSSGYCKDLWEFDPYTVSIDELMVDNAVLISPNPFTTETQITFSQTQRNSIITVTDILGREVRRINFNGKQWKLKRGTLKKGMYIVQVNDGKHIYASKLIIQ